MTFWLRSVSCDCFIESRLQAERKGTIRRQHTSVCRRIGSCFIVKLVEVWIKWWMRRGMRKNDNGLDLWPHLSVLNPTVHTEIRHRSDLEPRDLKKNLWTRHRLWLVPAVKMQPNKWFKFFFLSQKKNSNDIKFLSQNFFFSHYLISWIKDPLRRRQPSSDDRWSDPTVNIVYYLTHPKSAGNNYRSRFVFWPGDSADASVFPGAAW